MVLGELLTTTRLIPSEENERLYDNLREKILIMFNLQKTYKKKEIVSQLNGDFKLNIFYQKEAKLLEDKIKKYDKFGR